MHLTIDKEAPCLWASSISGISVLHIHIQDSKIISFKWVAEQQRALLQVLAVPQAAITLGQYDLPHPVLWEVSVVGRDAIWQVPMGEP